MSTTPANSSPTLTPVESPDTGRNSPIRAPRRSSRSSRNKGRKSSLVFVKTNDKISAGGRKDSRVEKARRKLSLNSSKKSGFRLDRDVNTRRHIASLNSGKSMSSKREEQASKLDAETHNEVEIGTPDKRKENLRISDKYEQDMRSLRNSNESWRMNEESKVGDSTTDDEIDDEDEEELLALESNDNYDPFFDDFGNNRNAELDLILQSKIKSVGVESSQNRELELQESNNESGPRPTGSHLSHDANNANFDLDKDHSVVTKQPSRPTSQEKAVSENQESKQTGKQGHPTSGGSHPGSATSQARSSATLEDILARESLGDELSLKSLLQSNSQNDTGSARSQNSVQKSEGESFIKVTENDGLYEPGDSVERSYFAMFKSSESLNSNPKDDKDKATNDIRNVSAHGVGEHDSGNAVEKTDDANQTTDHIKPVSPEGNNTGPPVPNSDSQQKDKDNLNFENLSNDSTTTTQAINDNNQNAMLKSVNENDVAPSSSSFTEADFVNKGGNDIDADVKSTASMGTVQNHNRGNQAEHDEVLSVKTVDQNGGPPDTNPHSKEHNNSNDNNSNNKNMAGGSGDDIMENTNSPTSDKQFDRKGTTDESNGSQNVEEATNLRLAEPTDQKMSRDVVGVDETGPKKRRKGTISDAAGMREGNHDFHHRRESDEGIDTDDTAYTQRSDDSVEKKRYASDTSSKTSFTRHSITTYRSPEDMRAIDRLRTGPYAKSLKTPLRKITVPKDPHYKNPTRSSKSKVRPVKASEIKEAKSDKKDKRKAKSTAALTGKKLTMIPIRKLKSDNSQTSSLASEDEKSKTVKEDKRRPLMRKNGQSSESKIPIFGLKRKAREDSVTSSEPEGKHPPQTMQEHPTNLSTLEIIDVKETTKPNIEERIHKENMVEEAISEPKASTKTVNESHDASGSERTSDPVITESKAGPMDVPAQKNPEDNVEFADRTKPVELSNPEIEKTNGTSNVKNTKDQNESKPRTLKDWFRGKKGIAAFSNISTEKSSDGEGTPKTQRSILDANSIIITTSTPDSPPEPEKDVVAKPEERPSLNPPLSAQQASVTVIDETTANDSMPTSKIGQLIINSIKQKVQEKNLSASINSNASLGMQGNGIARSPSPDGHHGGPFRERRNTNSMSSLTVPGLSVHQSPWDAPLEEDTDSLRGSSRQSFDSVSRKSVDYRVRDTTLVIQPTIEEKPKSILTNDETFIKSAIPFLPISLAVVCLLLNIFIPGSGTALSGLAILCCGKPRVSTNKNDQVLTTVCANLMVGMAQLCTVTFLLVGWFWSIGWGILMVSLSVQYRQALKEQRAKELQAMALSAFNRSPSKRFSVIRR